jgi:glycosyltransferase involved in cell wall biosynthesis
MDSTFINLEALIKEAGLSMPTLPVTSYIAPSAPAQPVVKKRKFMLVGTHAHQTTGYSKVTYHLIQELSKCHDIELYHFGFQKFLPQPPTYRVYPPGVDVYDPVEGERTRGAPQEMGFGYSQLPEYVRKVRPDVMLIYNDAGVICQFLNKLAEQLKPEERTYKTIIYLDQVYIVQRPELLGRIDKDADVYFAFTDYWKEILHKQGINKPIHILRHGFDPAQFKPLDRMAMRRKHGLPENAFIFLNLNRNTPRKRHDVVVQAFAELVARFPTKPMILFAVCDGGQTGGFPIQEIYLRELSRLGLPLQFHAQKLLIPQNPLTYTDELINEMYAMSDVGITAADGEGFGLCQFEAMGVGIPQVVPHIGGFRDFCKHGVNALTVEPKHRSYIPLGYSMIGGFIEVVEPHDLALAAEEYLMDSELREKHGAAARETVLEYKWEKEVAKLADVVRSL